MQQRGTQREPYQYRSGSAQAAAPNDEGRAGGFAQEGDHETGLPLTDLSWLAVASQMLSGASATAVTQWVWPVSVARCWPVAGSRIRTDLSWLAGR